VLYSCAATGACAGGNWSESPCDGAVRWGVPVTRDGELFDLTEVDRLLSTTRTVRRRLDLERPVPAEVILECLELAHQSPIGGNDEVRRWLVITEQPLKVQLAAMYRSQAMDYLTSLVEASDPHTQRLGRSAMYLAENFERVPALVLSCLDVPVDLSNNNNAASYYGSVMPAIWSFQLALRSRGLGSAWTTLHLGRETDAAKLLGIPDGVTQVALLPVAYTVGTEFKRAGRIPITERTYWNAWGVTTVPSDAG
jgi:nitroreductase